MTSILIEEVLNMFLQNRKGPLISNFCDPAKRTNFRKPEALTTIVQGLSGKDLLYGVFIPDYTRDCVDLFIVDNRREKPAIYSGR
jgi:hypothetical protein